jgi:hypothetical protein
MYAAVATVVRETIALASSGLGFGRRDRRLYYKNRNDP